MRRRADVRMGQQGDELVEVPSPAEVDCGNRYGGLGLLLARRASDQKIHVDRGVDGLKIQARSDPGFVFGRVKKGVRPVDRDQAVLVFDRDLVPDPTERGIRCLGELGCAVALIGGRFRQFRPAERLALALVADFLGCEESGVAVCQVRMPAS